MNKQNWKDVNQEMERLRKLQDEAVANCELCREFANQMSLFLSLLEDLNCQSMANMAMDILLLCNPKVAIALRQSKYGKRPVRADESGN